MLRQTHLQDHELLRSADGELSERGQARVTAHLEQCPHCLERQMAIRQTLAMASAACRSDEVDAGQSASRARLQQALHAAAAASHRSWFARVTNSRLVSPMATAVGILVLFAAGLWVSQPAGRSGSTLLRGALPSSALTPGAVSSLTAQELCGGVRPSRIVSVESRLRVLRDYRMEQVPDDTYELDALVTPELGGTTDPRNLWPQPYAAPIWNARVKDELENLLPTLVCSNRLALADAQRDMATDWIAAYKRYFHTDAPLPAARDAAIDSDEHELILWPVESVIADVAGRAPFIGRH